MLLPPSGNPFKCHEDVLNLQPMIPPKCFDMFSPDWGMLRRSTVDAFNFFFKKYLRKYYKKVLVDSFCSFQKTVTCNCHVSSFAFSDNM